MKRLVLMLVLILAGCAAEVDVSCTEAQVNDGWLNIAKQQIRIDKITFVKTTYQLKSKRDTYRILIGVEGETFYYDDQNKQACDALLEKITTIKIRGKEL